VGDTGLEQEPKSPEETAISENKHAESGAVSDSLQIPPDDLAILQELWPKLLSVARQQILGLIQSMIDCHKM